MIANLCGDISGVCFVSPSRFYEFNVSLQLRAMMWYGTIDLRIAGPKDEVSTRELGSAVALYHVLRVSDSLALWKTFDEYV